MIVNDQQNTPLEDVLDIAISDTPLEPSRDRRVASNDTTGDVPISPPSSVVKRAPQVVIVADESTYLGSELKVISCYVATGTKEETTTSSASANVEDLVEQMGNLFSQQEEVPTKQTSQHQYCDSGV